MIKCCLVLKWKIMESGDFVRVWKMWSWENYIVYGIKRYYY